MKILYADFQLNTPPAALDYMLNLARSLAGKHEIVVAAPAASRLYRKAQLIQSIQVAALSEPGGIWSGIRACMVLRRLLRQGRFDLVHVQNAQTHQQLMLAVAGMRARPRIVFSRLGLSPALGRGDALRARFATDRVIAVNKVVERELAGSAYQACGLAVLRPAVDTLFYAPPPPESEQGLRDIFFGAGWQGKLLIGSAAGASGWQDLMEALALLPAARRDDVRVLVTGSKPSEAEQARLSELDLAGNFSWPGPLDDARAALAACQFGFVLSCSAAALSASQEMMALGLPVLCANVCGLPEYIAPGIDGWVVPENDPEAIAAVLLDILERPAQLMVMAAAARTKSLKEFNLDTAAGKMEALYRATLA